MNTYPLLGALSACLHAITALDDIGLQADWARSSMQLQKETTGIAEDSTRLITTPERRSAGLTVLTDGL